MPNILTEECISQLKDYFSGKSRKFHLKLYLSGKEFQLLVWKQLQKIPYKKTLSYSDVAKKISIPKAIRAVGNTNRINPISIIIPCHRVIGKNKDLVGYAGGFENKKYLLEHEKKHFL